MTGASKRDSSRFGNRIYPLCWRAECLRGPAAANGGAGKQDAPGAVAGLIGPPFWKFGSRAASSLSHAPARDEQHDRTLARPSISTAFASMPRSRFSTHRSPATLPRSWNRPAAAAGPERLSTDLDGRQSGRLGRHAARLRRPSLERRRGPALPRENSRLTLAPGQTSDFP